MQKPTEKRGIGLRRRGENIREIVVSWLLPRASRAHVYVLGIKCALEKLN